MAIQKIRAMGVRLAMVFMVVLGTLGLQAAPAHAAGTTTNWSFTGRCCIYVPGGGGTDSWFSTNVEKDVFFRIDNFSPCAYDSNYGYAKITVELWRDDFGGDTKIGSDKTITCTGTAKWALVNPNQYHFHMVIQYPWRNQHTYTASGRYAYNGNTL